MRLESILAQITLSVLASPGAAQELVLTNARILDGTGRAIERGTLVLELITSVTEGVAKTEGPNTIDLGGRTVLPGLIDTHRHDLLSDLMEFASLESDADVKAAVESEAPARLLRLLEEGFTTVMMPGIYLQPALEVRRRLSAGEFPGPRFLFSGPGLTAPDDFPVRGMVCGDNAYCSERVAFELAEPDEARARVQELVEAEVDVLKVFVDQVGNALGDDVLDAITSAGEANGLSVAMHAHDVENMLHGVRHGVDRLVHTPGDVAIGDGARLLRENGVAIATTVSFGSPHFAEAVGFPYSGAESHALVLQNIRHLVDEGVVVAFGTDSPDPLRPSVEIEELSQVLSPEEILATLTRNAAIFLNLEDQIGTLAPGKVADIVVVAGNPLDDLSALSNVTLVVQAGRIVVDRR